MTLPELYREIGGDYDQALRVLRIDKLIDKHIRKLPNNGLVENLLEAGKTMDPDRLFEAAHAMKGNCANLGLTGLSALASDIAEAYRPGNPHTLSEAETAEKLEQIGDLYRKTAEGIRKYEGAVS